MNNSMRRLDFDQVCDLFVQLGAKNSPAEMHGLLVGQLAAGNRLNPSEWLNAAIDFIDTSEPFTKEVEEQVQFIYMATLTMLTDDNLGFYPLLPNDETEIEARLSSLGIWCQGFLVGFALTEKTVEDLPEIVNDAINDLAAIAHVGMNETDEWDESAEEDYFQIIEFIRLAVMNIFLEYAPLPPLKKSEAQNVTKANAMRIEEKSNSDEESYLTVQSLFKSRQLH